MHKRLFRSLGLLAFALMLAVPFSQGADRRFEKTFPVTPGGTLTLKTDIGSISIRGADVSEVSVVAEIEGGEKDVEKFVITAEKTGKGVEVTAEVPNRRKGRGSTDLDVQFAITVPREYNVALMTSGGSIDVASVKGEITGQTSGGGVSVVDTEGAAAIKTSGGSIKADRGRGSLEMKTSGGSISVKDFIGDIDLKTSGGEVEAINVDGTVHAQTSGGSVNVALSGPNRGVRAQTSGGGVTIAVPKDVKADLDLATSGGYVACDIPVTVQGKIDQNAIRGTVNGGGKLIWAHTSGGNVKITVKE